MFQSNSKAIAEIAQSMRREGREALMDRLNSHLQVRCSVCLDVCVVR